MEIREDLTDLFGLPKIKGKSLIGLILIISTISGLILTGTVFIILGFAEAAMLSLTGAFLSSIVLWVFLFSKQVEKFLRLNEPNIPLKNKILLLIVSVSIFGILVTIFFTGNSVAWWRVRVNEQSYDIGGFTIPKALTTVGTTFFSSILLLTWTILRKVSIQADDLKNAELNNENPLLLIERRERYISRTLSGIGRKGVIFIVIIGVTIIFASDLSYYATQGILIIIPFALAAFITLFSASYYQKKKRSPVQFALDNLTKCPNCGNKTALGGTYCEECGTELVLGKRYSNGVECNKCGQINSEDNKFCRYCNNLIKTQTKLDN